MNRKALKEKLEFFICSTHGFELETQLEKLLDEIELEHRKAMRPLCVTLAEIGIAVINDAQDTCWVSNSETALDRIFNELALDMDAREGAPKEQLEGFIKFGVNTWPEKLKEKKFEQPVQLELSPQNET